MEHFWRGAGLKQELAKRLEGAAPDTNSYKYNSLLVISRYLLFSSNLVTVLHLSGREGCLH